MSRWASKHDARLRYIMRSQTEFDSVAVSAPSSLDSPIDMDGFTARTLEARVNTAPSYRLKNCGFARFLR